jgi:organic radical activating enzyme
MYLSELFFSVQGEGFHSGRGAWFIRFPGCNLNCEWCDTDHKKKTNFTLRKLKNIFKENPNQFAVITGGEPSINENFEDLYKLLKSFGYEIAIETNGTTFHKIMKEAWLTVSPKLSQMEPDLKVLSHADEIKFVVNDNFDFSVLKEFEKYGKYHWLSPEYSNMKRNAYKIMEYIKTNQFWHLSLQVHKWINIP